MRALEQELADKEDEVEEVREQAEAEADAARLAQMQVRGCIYCTVAPGLSALGRAFACTPAEDGRSMA